MRFRCGVTSLRLRFHRSDTWPVLSWLARCRPGDEVVDVIHGTHVEAAPDWFCEAVWDGAYESGDFDRTDIVFGSGGRARDGGITFVSSGATVDRIQTMESGEEVWVSNSLPCLLAISGGQLDPAYPHYFRDFSSIRLGLSRYASQVATNRGVIRLTYFNNVVWDGQRLRTLAKPNPSRDFGTFERYRDFLEATLQRVGRNLTASVRQYPYRFLGTISSGYDSPAVAVLARQAGLEDVISFDGADAGESDSGQEIATRPFQLVTGRQWKGSAFGGARGRTDVPKIVDWYMDGKIQIDPMITHTMPLADINKAFDLMHAGESIRSVVIY